MSWLGVAWALMVQPCAVQALLSPWVPASKTDYKDPFLFPSQMSARRFSRHHLATAATSIEFISLTWTSGTAGIDGSCACNPSHFRHHKPQYLGVLEAFKNLVHHREFLSVDQALRHVLSRVSCTVPTTIGPHMSCGCS